MTEWMWRIVAWVITRRPINDWIVTRALRNPRWEIRDAEGNVSARRWWLFIPRKWCPVHAQMHMIPHAEAGPHLHSHPWSVRTIVLAGNCVEARGDGTSVFMGVGGTSLTRFGQFRRIVSTDAVRGVVVLLIAGRERGPWGFLVPHREYMAGGRK